MNILPSQILFRCTPLYGNILRMHLTNAMTKPFLLLLCFPFCLNSCTNKISNHPMSNKSNFQVFEISFTNGWTRGFSFLVDTCKIFIASTKADTVQFGLLPDSIFKLIDTTLLVLRNDTTIKSKVSNCSDCSAVSLKAIFTNDTIRIFQAGDDIDKIFMPVISILQAFIGNSHHTEIAALNWDTQSQILPPSVLPPGLDKTKFKSPK